MLKTTTMLSAITAVLFTTAQAQDAEGCTDHPAISRYPDTALEWCETLNFSPFRIPLSGVTGYRTIGEWEDVEGRLVRDFYAYRGTDRTHAEVYANYRDAMEAGGFEIIDANLFPNSGRDREVGGRAWQEVYFIENKWGKKGVVATMMAGTSSSGGSGAIVAKKARANDTIYAVVNIEQHSDEMVGVLVDIVETKPAETGLVTADADAMGKDLEEKGRTVLNGLFFEHDKAALMPESAPALDEIVKVLTANPETNYFIVGHTDATGTFAYNMKLSSDRAEAVRHALLMRDGIEGERLEAHGVGPLVPVFSNSEEGGRAQNRRVELVEK